MEITRFGFRSGGELYYTKLGVERVDEKRMSGAGLVPLKTIGDYLNPDNGISQNDICLYVKGTIVNSEAILMKKRKGFPILQD